MVDDDDIHDDGFVHLNLNISDLDGNFLETRKMLLKPEHISIKRYFTRINLRLTNEDLLCGVQYYWN